VVETLGTPAGGFGAMERIREYEELKGVQDPAVAANAHRSGLGVVFWVSFGWVAAMILLAIFASVLPLTTRGPRTLF